MTWAASREPFLLASGKLQTLCYKEEIESALAHARDGGFQLLDLHDFPGQGTALVGVLDPFWEEKGYVSAEEYRRFCGPTVPLARLVKRVFTQDDDPRRSARGGPFRSGAAAQCLACVQARGRYGRTYCQAKPAFRTSLWAAQLLG